MFYLKILRFEAWVSKYPGFAVALLVSVINQVPYTADNIILALLIMTGHLATGYIANDLADWDTDIKAGDNRELHKLTKNAATILVCAICFAYILTIFYLTSTFVFLICFVSFILHLSYSFFPRFKNRGILSVISSSLNQWVAPFVIYMVIENTFTSNYGVLSLLVVCLFLMGINGAISNQIRDYYRDQNQTETFVQKLGDPKKGLTLLRANQIMCIIAPLTFLIIVPPATALVSIIILITYVVYHTLYYKGLENC